VGQEISTRRTAPHHDEVGIQLAGGTDGLSPNIAGTDEMACVDAGSTGSIHNPFQLGRHRPVRIAQSGAILAGKDVQRHELRMLPCGDRDGTVDRGPIHWPSIGGKQHDP
jgi:hypothetical protein